MKKSNYASPVIEVTEVEVELGFATSPFGIESVKPGDEFFGDGHEDPNAGQDWW